MNTPTNSEQDSVESTALLCFGVPCDLNTWLASPERILKHFRDCDTDGVTALEINRRRWGSYVPVRVDVEDLKACSRHGLVRCKKGKWFLIQHNSKINE